MSAEPVAIDETASAISKSLEGILSGNIKKVVAMLGSLPIYYRAIWDRKIDTESSGHRGLSRQRGAGLCAGRQQSRPSDRAGAAYAAGPDRPL
jgi:hypothetical protein